MKLSRRGFLQTLGAAAVSAAVFDTASKLWVPGAKEIVAPPLAFHRDAFGMVMAPLKTERAAQRAIETQAELNELAMKFARLMTDRLERHPAVALREVMYRLTGTVDLPPDVLAVTDLGIGRFAPAPQRLMKTAGGMVLDLHTLANQMRGELDGYDMFAPLGVELRPGEPFSRAVDPHDDARVDIGLATDAESGVSVRVLRFRMDARGGRPQRMTGFEMAGGSWQPAHGKAAAKFLAAAINSGLLG